MNRLISVFKERKSPVELSANQIVVSLKKISEEMTTRQDSKQHEITEEQLALAVIRLESLFDPVSLYPALYPRNTLADPVELVLQALSPTATFWFPVVLPSPVS